MKKFVFALIGLFLLGLLASAAVLLLRPGAALFEGENYHDFGVIPVGEAQTHVFRLTNASNDGIFIERHRTNCKCLEASLNRKGLDPGDVLEVTATMQSDEPADKTVDVMLDLGERGIYRCTVHATFIADGPLAP